jgi:hypothetical protein
MKAVLITVVVIAIIAAIASGVWVAVALVRAICPKAEAGENPAEQTRK